jgi:hypothetical protein
MTINFCGFTILRQPKFNFDKEGRGTFLPCAPKINDTYYSGIDRMQWFEIDEAYYNNRLPEELVKLRKEIKLNKQDDVDFKLIGDISKAQILLGFANKFEPLNEIVAVASQKQVNKKKFDDCDISILGIDIYCHGYGSLIREGLFCKPDFFHAFHRELNANGLFEWNSELIDEYIRTYTQCSDRANIEPIQNAMKYIDKMRRLEPTVV